MKINKRQVTLRTASGLESPTLGARITLCANACAIKPQKNDRPGYSCERTPWVLVTGAEPLNCPAPPNLPESLTQCVRLRLPQSHSHNRLSDEKMKKILAKSCGRAARHDARFACFLPLRVAESAEQWGDALLRLGEKVAAGRMRCRAQTVVQRGGEVRPHFRFPLSAFRFS
jgi:hypothetical protein